MGKDCGANRNQPDRERRCAAQYEARDQIGLDTKQANRASVVGNGTKTAFAEIGAPGKVNPSPCRHNNYRETLSRTIERSAIDAFSQILLWRPSALHSAMTNAYHGDRSQEFVSNRQRKMNNFSLDIMSILVGKRTIARSRVVPQFELRESS